MAKKQFLKTFFLDSTYRGYRGHFPDIAIATAKFPISRYRDDRDLSVCLPVGELLQLASIPEARKGALTQRRLFFI